MPEISIAFTGDITFNKYFSSVTSISSILDDELALFLRNADHCIGNVEGAVTHVEDPAKGEFKHHSDSRCAAMLREMNIDIWNIANNHALDFGKQGIADTYRNAQELGCSVIGISENLAPVEPFCIPEAGGIGILSVTYSEPAMRNNTDCAYIDWRDFENIAKHISNIKRQNRWCVVISHGGEEFSDMPTPDTRANYLQYLNLGADIVVGHHPHTVQNYEVVGDKTVFYSLGNFVFDTDYQRAQLHTEYGELLKIHFTEQSYNWENCPFLIDRDKGQIRKGTDPIVFQNIAGKEYNRLWPYAAIGFSKAERSKLTYLNPKKYQKFNGVKWFARDIKVLEDKNRRVSVIGKYAGIGKKILRIHADRETVGYLSHS